jgi:serine/threonine protein phosphatase PrpC
MDIESRQALVGDPPDTQRSYPYVVINYEHRPGLGEDADPICRIWPPNGLVGVFDGLGGAGGETIEVGDGKEHTGAWMASRIAHRAVRRCISWIDEGSSRDDDRSLPPPPDFTAKLDRAIREDLAQMAARIRTGVSTRLRSRLIKTLPTTMAVAWFDVDKRELTAIWAGDSRVYFLHPAIGLVQVTTDDLKTNADALENLTQDSPMSNFVSADEDFVVHERRLEFNPLTIVLAATDGCFGYVHTPMHFEFMLLSTMRDADNWNDWSDRLTAAIKKVTGDDATLAAIVVGWDDIGPCQRQFAARRRWCAERIAEYEKLSDHVAELQQQLDGAKRELAEGRRRLWDGYRRSYESVMRLPPRDIRHGRPIEHESTRPAEHETEPSRARPPAPASGDEAEAPAEHEHEPRHGRPRDADVRPPDVGARDGEASPADEDRRR